MSNWIICNKCTIPYKFLPKGKSFYLSSCGGILCETCHVSSRGGCFKCASHTCDRIKFDDMDSSVSMYFKPLPQVIASLEDAAKIFSFQESQYQLIFSSFCSLFKKCHQMSATYKTHLTQIEQKYQTVKAENEQLRAQQRNRCLLPKDHSYHDAMPTPSSSNSISNNFAELGVKSNSSNGSSFLQLNRNRAMVGPRSGVQRGSVTNMRGVITDPIRRYPGGAISSRPSYLQRSQDLSQSLSSTPRKSSDAVLAMLTRKYRK